MPKGYAGIAVQAERSWLEWVRNAAELSRARPPHVRVGIGDDAAVLRPRRGWEMVATTDLFVEGVHFLRARDRAASCGRRLATRALSDLAAMGAEPMALLVSSLYPKSSATAWAREFYRGLLDAAAEAGAALAGGDMATVRRTRERTAFDVVGLGQVPRGQALLRSGARAGDRIYVSGRLGEAALGRELVHRGRRAENAEERRARERHIHPRARWELGQALRGRASAAIDLSDGLATDLHHLCHASGVGAEIEMAMLLGVASGPQLRRALFGGEDYELLFTLPRGQSLPRPRALGHGLGLDLTCIGQIKAARNVWLRRADGRRERVPDAGFEH